MTSICKNLAVITASYLRDDRYKTILNCMKSVAKEKPEYYVLAYWSDIDIDEKQYYDIFNECDVKLVLLKSNRRLVQFDQLKLAVKWLKSNTDVKYIGFIDDDDELLPNTIEKLGDFNSNKIYKFDSYLSYFNEDTQIISKATEFWMFYVPIDNLSRFFIEAEKCFRPGFKLISGTTDIAYIVWLLGEANEFKNTVEINHSCIKKYNNSIYYIEKERYEPAGYEKLEN
jgi:hypothetical protein